MSIERVVSASLTWRDGGGNVPYTVQARGLKRSEDTGLTWTPDEGIHPVGEFLVRGGFIVQPVFRAETRAYTDLWGASCTDHKFVFDIALVEQADHSSYSFLAGAVPDEATIDGRYNAAYDPRDAGEGPWGCPADVGGEFLDLLVTDGVAVPQFVEGNQIYALDLESGGRLWHKSGNDIYPTALANFGPDDDAYEFGEDYERSDLDYTRERFSALGISGPGEDRRLIVEITKEWLAPDIRPDFINGIVDRTVEVESFCSGEPLSFSLQGTLRSIYEWRSSGPLTTSPSTGLSGLGFFEGSSWLFGNPQMAGVPTNFGQQFISDTASPHTDALAQLVADAELLAETTKYIGHFVHKVEKRIESWNLSTGAVLATRACGEPCRLPGKNMNGPGMVTQTPVSQATILSWPEHPGLELEDWTPDVPGRKMHHPPPQDQAGYIGGSYEQRAFGPLFLHTIDESANTGSVTLRTACPGETPITWTPYYSMRSIHAGDLIATGTVPTGIYLPTLSDGSFTVAPEGDSYLTCCYSAIAGGDKAKRGRELPWPFDPLSMACDATTIIFGPSQFGHNRMALTREGQALAPGGDFDLPEWDDEVERTHKIVAWNPLTLADLWEIDARDHITPTTLANGRLHPNAGDRIGNLAIYKDHLWIGLNGNEAQRLLEIRIRETDDGAAGQVARTIAIRASALLGAPFYVNTSALLLAPTNSEFCQDSLVIAGGRLWGLTSDGRIWQLI